MNQREKKMKERTFSHLRGNLASLCDQAVEDREPIRIRRGNGKDVVIVAADEFESMSETAHLLSSPRNAARLLAALAQARKGTTRPMSVEELRAALGL